MPNGKGRVSTRRATAVCALWASAAFLFTACPQQKKTLPPSLRPRVTQLESQVKWLTATLDAVQTDTTVVRVGGAEVSTESPGYSILTTNFGAFVVSCENLTPYLDGYKLRLSFGNTTAAAFHGATIHVRWGPQLTTQPVEQWSKTQKRRDFQVTSTFRPGAYDNVEVTLTPAKPDDVKTISVDLELNQLSLRR